MIFKAKEIAQALPLNKEVFSDLILADRALDLGLRKILINPKLKTAQKEIIEAILANHASKEVINLIAYLAAENRLKTFKKVLQEYQRLLEKKAVRAEIITALPLSPLEKIEYQKKLEQKTGLEILLENKVDPQIIGGAIIKIGNKAIDNSFKTKLKTLR